MKPEDIKHDAHYAVRIGGIPFTGRVDAFQSPKLKWLAPTFVTFICEWKAWKALPPSAFLYKCRPPAEFEAIQTKKHTAWKEGFQQRLATQEATGRLAPARVAQAENREAIIHRQGSVFHAGDHGITRER
jgi:hypothetical protein